ncbi:family 43 glycosylhydrolase [Agromyces intestinalis]|uniref:Family 43 glycosylhydrolase n=1 Tax=Agromyces intestinalis TaxID=2592652 RepID=A0A5C1YCQ9_9MICO|nr:RICIN domain-containing protein [Agromyces intestinalis]QEO13398.1 family 43 glycosylhydrolase [Agromyces intestinalis]
MSTAVRRDPTRRRTIASFILTAVLAGGLALNSATAEPAEAAVVSIANATQFTDTAGSPVHAHGGGVVKSGSYYYWVGENRHNDNKFRYVSCYRSTDLKNWAFVSNILSQSSASELQSANIERPKLMYNASTDRYVLWMHKENGTNYSEARAAVAVSNTNAPCGSYTYRGSFRPLDHMSRDIGVFVDTDGAGYMYSAARENYDLHIYRLTADYTGIASLVANPWPGGHREAPALFKRGSVYFMLTSGATGWSPNQQQYATASSLAGPWTAMKNVGDSTAYGSQTTFVLPVQGSSGTSYLYMGDRWGDSIGSNVNGSKYVWAPITFSNSTTMSFSYFAELQIDTAAGTISGQGGSYQTVKARHSGKCADITSASGATGAQLKQWGCNGGSNQAFWFKDAGGGYVNLVARHSNLCLQENASTVTQENCGTGTNQQWQVQTSGSYVQIQSRATGECLDVNGASTADGAAIITYTCNGATNQQWTRTAT